MEKAAENSASESFQLASLDKMLAMEDGPTCWANMDSWS